MKINRFLWLVLVCMSMAGYAQADRLSDLQDSIDQMRIDQLDQQLLKLIETRSGNTTRSKQEPRIKNQYINDLIPLVKDSKGVSYYIDKTSISKRNSDEIGFIFVTNAPYPRYYSRYVYFSSWIGMHVKCSSPLVEMQTETFFSEQYGEGTLLGVKFPEKEGFAKINPNSVISVVRKFVCKGI